MPSSLRKALVERGVLCVLVAWAAAQAGCAQEGYTPACDDNVTKDGILIHKGTNPCNKFPLCSVGGEVHPATDCCKDETGKPLEGYALQQCLYGFGALDLDPTGGGGGSGGGSTSTGS
jgi:hypothetical protein